MKEKSTLRKVANDYLTHTKNIKGITLVSLVITIIILLILAGISISALTQTGLFEKAKQAEQKSKDAQELENATLASYENSINEIISTGSREENSNNNQYSLEEKAIGTWIDGKTIYRKIINFTTSNSYTKIGTLTNFENLIDARALEKDRDQNSKIHPNYTGGDYYTDFYVAPNGDVFWYSTSAYSNLPVTIVLEYTKK